MRFYRRWRHSRVEGRARTWAPILMNGTMPTAKEEIRRILDALPDDATWEDVQHSIYVRERVERGRREVQEDKIVADDEVERRMERWLTE